MAWAKQGINMKDEELSSHLIRFYEYFTQYDSKTKLKLFRNVSRNERFLE